MADKSLDCEPFAAEDDKIFYFLETHISKQKIPRRTYGGNRTLASYHSQLQGNKRKFLSLDETVGFSYFESNETNFIQKIFNLFVFYLILVTRNKMTDLSKRRTNRTVFNCYVFGPVGSGKVSKYKLL